MKHHVVGWRVAAFLAFCCPEAAVCQHPPLREVFVDRDNGAGAVIVSVERPTDIRYVRRLYTATVADARRVLIERAAGTLGDPGGFKTAEAAKILGFLRAEDGEAIKYLLKHLTFRPDSGISPDWPNGYVCAEALARIGGSRVTNTIVKDLSNEHSETELLLCAHILNKCDSVKITYERFRLEVEKAKLQRTALQLDTLNRNIARIKEWLNDPRFEEDDRFLPK